MKAFGTILLVLSLFASALGNVVDFCALSGDCSPVAEDDCAGCHGHGHDDAPSPELPSDDDSDEDSPRPHEHHHNCQITLHSVLPDHWGNGVQAPQFFSDQFLFLSGEPTVGLPFQLDRPPRG